MKTLILTSPHMKGPDVLTAQKTLNGDNVFKHDFLGGAVDGEFGPITAQSARNAKYWLGYAPTEVKPMYGDRLHAYLKGTTPLTKGMDRARGERLHASNPSAVTMGQKAVAFAGKFVGMHEQPVDSNHFPGVTDWYGMGDVSYCAEGVSRCYVAAGSRAFEAGHRYAYVPYILADAQRGVNGLHVIGYSAAREGDLVIFNWDGGAVDHVGLLVHKLSAIQFKTIEFNTSPTDGGNQSNGGGCYAKVRNLSTVAAFVRVTR